MSNVQDNDDSDNSSSENNFSDSNNKVSKSSLEEGCISEEVKKVNKGKRKILDKERENIDNDDQKLINIEGKKFKIGPFVSSESTKDEVIVTIGNDKFKLFTKKPSKIEKEDPDVDKNQRNEPKKNQSPTSGPSGLQKLPVVENRIDTPCYNTENIIQNRVSNRNEYRESIKSDTSKCLREMNEIIRLFIIGLHAARIGDETCSEFIDKVVKKINEENLSEDNENMVVITSSLLREHLKKYCLKKIRRIIEGQIENKKLIIMGYPELIRFDQENIRKKNRIEKHINFITLSEDEDSQSSSSEEQNADQSEMKNEEIPSNEKMKTEEEMSSNKEMKKYISAKIDLETMEFNNNERKKFAESLFKFMKLNGYFERIRYFELPTINDIPLDMFLLYKLVTARGGFVKVTELKLWPEFYRRIFGRNPSIDFHIYGYSPRIGSSFLQFYYKRYLHSYERAKELFTISSWLLPADNVYPSNIRTFSSKRVNPLNSERSNLSTEAIRYLVQYLRTNNYPNQDLFPTSLTYILKRFYYTEKNFPSNPTDQTSTEFQSEETKKQIAMKIKQDVSLGTILRTEESKINEGTESITESTKDHPPGTSKVTPEPELVLKSETKSEVKLTTKVSSKRAQKRKISFRSESTESNSSDE